MKDKIREQLSAFLDGQLEPLEHKQVEALLLADPLVRAELESLKQLSRSLNQAAPGWSQAPAEIREWVMERLRAAGAGGVRGGLAGAGMGKLSVISYWVAAAVLAGLLASLAFWDHRREKENKRPAPKQEMALPASEPEGSYGTGIPQTRPSVSAPGATQRLPAGAIRSLSGSSRTLRAHSNLKGPVYTIGNGQGSSTQEKKPHE